MRFHIGCDRDIYGTITLPPDGNPAGIRLQPQPGQEHNLDWLWLNISAAGDPLAWLERYGPPKRGFGAGLWAEPLPDA